MSMNSKEFETFSFEIQDEIAVFSVKGKTLFNASNLFEMDQLANSFRECADDNRVKVIVIKKSPQKKDGQEYHEFVRRASQNDGSLDLYRMLTFYNRFIMEIYSHKKFVVSVDSGNVIAQFFNLSLACDYRIIADDTVIQKEYLRNGVVPKGGAILFLSQLVGKQKAYEILLSDKNVTAQEALDWGLADELVPYAELDQATTRRALEFASVPKHTLTGIKSLMNYSVAELEKYLRYENDVTVRIFTELNRGQ
jgi:2-(1,2-epoxy-1,2-dihydrophenyl)acetyl-CoA isomerase